MHCPNCDHICEAGACFCSACGEKLPLPEDALISPAAPEEPAESDVTAQETPDIPAETEDPDITREMSIPEISCAGQQIYTPFAPARKGALWPPLAIMAVLMAIGLALFYLIPSQRPSSGQTPWFSVEEGVLYFNADAYTGSEELTVPETVNGQTVYALSDGCFAYCDLFTTVYLPDTLTSIGKEAFYDCENLRGILIPEQVTSIGEMAFLSCGELEAVCIPGSVRDMGADAFDGCMDLRYILYSGKIDQWHALYGESINPEVVVYAADGTYAHTGK